MRLVDRRRKWLAWLQDRGSKLLGRRRSPLSEADGPVLDAADCLTLETFERQVVELRLADDTKSRNTADEILDAILRDQPKFAGLKPLEFHSDNFTHEFLFPSWLNLYTAIVLSRIASGEPSYSEEQVRTLFRFLREFEEGGSVPADELVATFSLIVRRLPPGEAIPLVQRLINLGCAPDHGFRAGYAAKIAWLREQDESASGFMRSIRNWSAFESCAGTGPAESPFLLVTGLPRRPSLPSVIVRAVRALEGKPAEYRRWAALLEQIARVVEGVDCFDEEFVEFLNRRDDEIGEWLTILAPASGSALSAVCQRTLARIVRREELHNRHLDECSIRELGKQLAPRLNVLDGPSVGLFEAEYIEKDANRQLLFSTVQTGSQRGSMGQPLLDQARRTGDFLRLVRQLLVAAVLDPGYDLPQLSRMANTVTVLRLLAEQGFISAQQREYLASDIRQRLPDSCAFLGMPHLGAGGQDARIAKLYLALSEEVEKYEYSGQVGNFGLTSAAYGKLNRDISEGMQ